jgi:hypothetical protein
MPVFMILDNPLDQQVPAAAKASPAQGLKAPLTAWASAQ